VVIVYNTEVNGGAIMVEKYGVVFFYDEEYCGYVAEAVGLPGCFSQGKTMEEAIENIKDAIKGYLYVERKNKGIESFPTPRNYFLGEVSVG
jgi:predicted RNase H-like HicB family nuclease